MSKEQLCLYELYTRFSKSVRIITIIVKHVFVDSPDERVIDEELYFIRELASIKYMIEYNHCGIFHPVTGEFISLGRDGEFRRLWQEVIDHEVNSKAATGTRVSLPAPPPANLGYVSGASDTESEAAREDSASSSSDDSDATATGEEDRPPISQRCGCCEYCPSQSVLLKCPFADLKDAEREWVMTIFLRRRSPETSALMDNLQEKELVHRLCIKVMEHLKGCLSLIDDEGYLPNLVRVLEEDLRQRNSINHAA